MQLTDRCTDRRTERSFVSHSASRSGWRTISSFSPSAAATPTNNKAMDNEQWSCKLAVIVKRCMEAHPLPRGPRWIPLNPYPGFLNVAFGLTPLTMAALPLSPRYCAQGEDSHASLPPNGQRSTAGACEEPITGVTSPTSTPITTQKKQLADFMAIAVAVRSLMPDFAANQPAMLARLPLQDGLDWPDSRYGSAKNILDTHPWHHRSVLVEGGPAQSVPVRPPTCHAITTEKREAHTAGLGCGGPV